jgi:DNA-binding transcriptional ArsR family regulator
MSENERNQHGAWAIGRSMAIELDVVLSAIQGGFAVGGLPEEAVALLQGLPSDWQDDLSEMLGESRRLSSVLETAAALAGVLLEGNYDDATLAIRALSLDEALARTAVLATDHGRAPDAALPPAERLVELWMARRMAAFAEVGLTLKAGERVMRRSRQDVERAVRLLRGGALHARFWHWLDRFYYGVYQPWREARAGELAASEARARTALGGGEGWGGAPDLDWLSRLSPLRTYPELATAVQDGRLRVVFWVEPFGLADLWSLHPGLLLVSFAKPGGLYHGFEAFAADVAGRASALGDPTRLIILRMIRHFGMINTEMAAALGLARPTVSVHAKILREAGLIWSHRQGREVRHEVVPEEVARLFRDLRTLLDLEE